MSANVDPTGSGWVGAGLVSAPVGGYWNIGQLWVLLRPAGTYTVFADGTSSTLASGDVPGTAVNGFHHVEVLYDAVTGLATARINGTEVLSARPLGFTPNIGYAGYHVFNISGAPRLDHFNVRSRE